MLNNFKILYIFLLFIPIIIFADNNKSEKPLIKTKISKDRWIAIDKVQHFTYSCFVSLGSQYVLVNKLEMDEKNALPLSSLLSFSAGTLKELNDKRGGSYFSLKDMVANGLGIVFAGIIISNQTG